MTTKSEASAKTIIIRLVSYAQHNVYFTIQGGKIMVAAMNAINQIASPETCHLCGQTAPQSSSGVHDACADRENAGITIDPALATEVCRLCGKPSFPFENQAHSECAAYENFLASL
jgi:hypothetical protein